jgi:hypothetical protein
MRKDIIGAVVGFVIGGVISYLYCKKRFDEGCCGVVSNEIEYSFEGEDSSIKQTLGQECIDIAYGGEDLEYKRPDPRSYNKIVNKLYGPVRNEPFVITEREFSEECEDHDKITALYYDDGIVTDDRDEVMDNIIETFGKNFDKFGLWSTDKDVLYIRNDKLKIDFEVLRQNTTYRSEN